MPSGRFRWLLISHSRQGARKLTSETPVVMDEETPEWIEQKKVIDWLLGPESRD